MKIFLVGYMGCGKSLWGKMIANHYNYQFIDLDAYIEERENMSISEIFTKFKEEGFREREHKALKSISSIDNIIVATGGGTPCFYNNMEKMNHWGETLYIEGSPELLCERIRNSKKERPLVKNISQDELLGYIQDHLNSRKSFYELAKHKIVSGNLELNHFIQLIEPFINSNQ